MKKTLNRDNEKFLTVNADTLAGMLNCGRATAVKIGTDAGGKDTDRTAHTIQSFYH